MATATLVYIVVAAVLVFVMAAVVVGREAHRLDAVAPRSVYIPQEAMEFVAEYLPAESQARLTPDELELLLLAHMRWLHSKGLQPSNVVDRRQDIMSTVVIADDTVAGYLLGEAGLHKAPPTPVDVGSLARYDRPMPSVADYDTLLPGSRCVGTA